jgi:hypothetical protein
VADTRKTTIINSCLTAIGAIVRGSTYERTVSLARRNASALPEIPTADAVWVETTTQAKSTLTSGVAAVTLTVTFGCLVVDSLDLGKAVDDIEADVERALAVDITRGGYALDTRVVRTEEFIAEAQSPVGGALIDVEIKYRHADGNPYAAV